MPINKNETGSILVNVRRSGDTFIARAGVGKATRTASCTSSAGYAAQRAGEKYLGCKLDDCVVIVGDWNSGTQFSCYAHAAREYKRPNRAGGSAS